MDEDEKQKPRSPFFAVWRRVKQDVAPEQTWISEQIQHQTLDKKAQNQWLKRMSSGDRHIRQQAMREFHALPPAPRRLLTVRAYQFAVEQQSNTGCTTTLIVLMMLFVSMVGGLPWFTFALFCSMLVAACANAYMHTSRRLELAANLIDGTQDTQILPYLLTRLNFHNINNRAPRQALAGRTLRNALVRLLPHVQENEVNEWTGAQWRHLLFYLREPYWDVEITVAVLNFVARFGNEEALRRVEVLAKEGYSLKEKAHRGAARAAIESNHGVVEQAVQNCLPQLQDLVMRQRQAQTLLRASGNTAVTPSDILLRPASSFVSETPAEQLLRPQNPE